MKNKFFLLLILVSILAMLPIVAFASEETLIFKDEEGNILLTGEHVARASAQIMPNHAGVPETVVNLEFTEEGTYLFADITRNNIGRKIYIYVDGKLVTSPIVNSVITDGTAVITGNFTAQTAAELARTLNGEGEPNRQENVVGRIINWLRDIFKRRI